MIADNFLKLSGYMTFLSVSIWHLSIHTQHTTKYKHMPNNTQKPPWLVFNVWCGMSIIWLLLYPSTCYWITALVCKANRFIYTEFNARQSRMCTALPLPHIAVVVVVVHCTFMQAHACKRGVCSIPPPTSSLLLASQANNKHSENFTSLFIA